MKHPVEDVDSWELFQQSNRALSGNADQSSDVVVSEFETLPNHRQLKHRHPSNPAEVLEKEKEDQFWQDYRHEQDRVAKIRKEERRKHDATLQELWANPGIGRTTHHGLMIDAGSTGSRMHIYEWEPRVLRNEADIEQAVSGNKLTFPGTDSRWTDRLRPGLASFAEIESDEGLRAAVAEYLEPLLDFARTVLHEKETEWGTVPIFLRATAGMRILPTKDRSRVMGVVRSLFANTTYCQFSFVDEQARVLSGEEESIYDWAGVNFLMGELLQQSEGAGTVINPKRTHGALDLGGASTQISFYEPSEDIMSNLFKLQIGQAKHWNVYAHSFLFYGMNEAIHRFTSRLAAGKTTEERLVEGIYNPCLPGGATTEIRSNIHLTPDDNETWNYTKPEASGDGFYQAVLKNDGPGGDFEKCMELTKDLLHLEKNSWCEFAHKGDCSFAGIYQPELPTDREDFGEFVAFSNYYHVWKFLHLPERATLNELHDASQRVCSMSREELVEYNQGKVEEDELDSYCFRSIYAFQLLRNGYGFQMDDTIRATRVLNGHKVGWALGAMLYEINSMPWHYMQDQEIDTSAPGMIPEISHHEFHGDITFFVMSTVALFAALVFVFVVGRRRKQNPIGYRWEYEPVKEVDV